MNQEKASSLIDKLLKSSAGREVLGKRFNMQLRMAGQDAPASDKPMPRVAVLVPCYKSPETEMKTALHEMIKFTNASGEAIGYWGPFFTQASVVHFVRNELITALLKSQEPFTHVLFLDDDIVPEKDALLKLLAHEKDIVGAVCTTRRDPPIPNIREWDEEAKVLKEIWYWKENGLKEVGGVGTGMLLISADALEKVAEAYFTCAFEKEMFQLPDERAQWLEAQRRKRFDETAKCMWFRFLSGLAGYDEWGEDMSFSLMAWRYAGIPVYCDTSVQPMHIGQYGYSVRDFLPHRDEALAKAKAEGRVKTFDPTLIAEMANKSADYESRISIILPSRGREAETIRLIESIKETSLKMPEIIVYQDDDDIPYSRLALTGGVLVVQGPRQTLSKCWNQAVKHATGNILMLGGDDLIFRTKGWDAAVAEAFESCPDKILFVHGDDGAHGANFGTHGFIHRKWMETVGYFVPPYFSSDYNDTWLNDVANALGRRLYIPFVTEHMHPLFGKAEWDTTHKERLERQKEQNTDELYKKLLPERQADADKLAKVIRNGQSSSTRQPELAALQSA